MFTKLFVTMTASILAMTASVAVAQSVTTVAVVWDENNEGGEAWASAIKDSLNESLSGGVSINALSYADAGNVDIPANVIVSDAAVMTSSSPVVNLGPAACVENNLHINAIQDLGGAAARYFSAESVRRLFAYTDASEAGQVFEADFREQWQRGLGGAQRFDGTESDYRGPAQIVGISRAQGLLLNLPEASQTAMLNQLAKTSNLPDNLNTILIGDVDTSVLTEEAVSYLDTLKTLSFAAGDDMNIETLVAAINAIVDGGVIPGMAGSLDVNGDELAIAASGVVDQNFWVHAVSQSAQEGEKMAFSALLRC